MKKKRLKARCQKCGNRISGKICYYQRRRFCRKCFNNIKYESDGRRSGPRGLRGRPPTRIF